MSKEWQDGEVVKMKNKMMDLTVNIICKTVLNYEFATESKKIRKALPTCRNYSKRLNPIGQVLDKIPILPKVRGTRQALRELNSIVCKVIEDRRIKEFRLMI